MTPRTEIEPRDLFAAAALLGILIENSMCPEHRRYDCGDREDAITLSARAFYLADRMCAERDE